jgi:hypothetical protein
MTKAMSDTKVELERTYIATELNGFLCRLDNLRQEISELYCDIINFALANNIHGVNDAD